VKAGPNGKISPYSLALEKGYDHISERISNSQELTEWLVENKLDDYKQIFLKKDWYWEDVTFFFSFSSFLGFFMFFPM